MALAGDGILPCDRLAEPVVAVEAIGDREQPLDGCDVDFAFGHRIEAGDSGKVSK